MVVDLTVCQGVGDIFWTYQQFIRSVDGIRYHVADPGVGHKLTSRSFEFIGSLPGVVSIDPRPCTEAEYQHLAHDRFDAAEVLRAGGGWYACNNALESEIRLEDCCGGLPVLERAEIKTQPIRLPPKFIAVYIAESTCAEWYVAKHGVWTVAQWAEFVHALYERFGFDLPLVLLGAEYDRRPLEEVAAQLKGIVTYPVIGRPLAEACHVLERASLLLGFQSGLGVIADQFDTPQVHLYMECVWGIRNSWPKRRNLGTVYQPFGFRQSPAEVAASVIWPIPTTAGTNGASANAT